MLEASDAKISVTRVLLGKNEKNSNFLKNNLKESLPDWFVTTNRLFCWGIISTWWHILCLLYDLLIYASLITSKAIRCVTFGSSSPQSHNLSRLLNVVICGARVWIWIYRRILRRLIISEILSKTSSSKSERFRLSFVQFVPINEVYINGCWLQRLGYLLG